MTQVRLNRLPENTELTAEHHACSTRTMPSLELPGVKTSTCNNKRNKSDLIVSICFLLVLQLQAQVHQMDYITPIGVLITVAGSVPARSWSGTGG